MAKSKPKPTAANYEAIRNHIFDRIHKTGEEIKNDLPNVLRTAIQSQAWKHFADGEGRPFPDLVSWLQYTFPNGAGMGQGKNAITYEEALKLTEGHPDVHRVLAKNAPKRKAGRPSNGTIPTVRSEFIRSGLKKPILTARLAQQHPKVYEAYLRGEYRSIRAAAEAAGLVPPGNDPLARLKSTWRRATVEQQKAFQEWIKAVDADAKSKK